MAKDCKVSNEFLQRREHTYQETTPGKAKMQRQCANQDCAQRKGTLKAIAFLCLKVNHKSHILTTHIQSPQRLHLTRKAPGNFLEVLLNLKI